MKKIIQQQKIETYCDITGEKLNSPENILCFSIISAHKDDLKEYDDPDLAWDQEYFEWDLSNEVAFEILKFLMRKYPNIKEKFKDKKIEVLPDYFL